MLSTIMIIAQKDTGIPKIRINPDPSALPGNNSLQVLINGFAWIALGCAVLGGIIGLASLAIGHWGSNPHMAGKAKSGAFLSLGVAFGIGILAVLINFFVELGSKAS